VGLHGDAALGLELLGDLWEAPGLVDAAASPAREQEEDVVLLDRVEVVEVHVVAGRP